jgi:hypothetical protein
MKLSQQKCEAVLSNNSSVLPARDERRYDGEMVDRGWWDSISSAEVRVTIRGSDRTSDSAGADACSGVHR